MSTATVSVVIVNYNGREHLEPCFSALAKQTYPHELIEYILIDNDSHDGSRAFIAQHFPHVQVIHNTENVGFAPAVNQGAELATGDYLALLNNDTYADANWLHELVCCLEEHAHDDVVCVGSVMYDWHGRTIDFVRAGVNFYGYGNQVFHGLSKDSMTLKQEYSLLACGGAMLVRRDIFLKLGGFDADFFAYYEDIDFGWRTWLAGYKIMVEPKSFVYHRHHGTIKSFRVDQMDVLYQRNALATIIKNYSDDSLQQTLPAALMLLLQKSIAAGEAAVPWEQFDLRYRGEHAASIEVPKAMLSYLAAARDILSNFTTWWEKRAQVQALRRRSDNEIFPLFDRPFAFSNMTPSYAVLQKLLIDAFGVDSLFRDTKASRVLVISSDPLSDQLAGPGIRAVEIARQLAAYCHITLAAPFRADIHVPDVEVVAFELHNQQMVARLINDCDIVVVQNPFIIMHHYQALTELNRIIVIDLYDPIHFENVDLLLMHHPLERARMIMKSDIGALSQEIHIGDFFMCASERQRDMWLGWLSAAGRITPDGYREDVMFRSLIDVVPFGLADQPPVATKAVLKGVVPGIDIDDTVLLWNGGIWEWFDPLTLIRAMSQLRSQRPDVKLFFMGARHPNPDVPEMRMYNRAVLLAEELGVKDQTVFFNDSWVPYAERQNYLLEADWAVSCHIFHIETRFSFRTRLLDCIWASLPMIISTGDVLSEYVEQHDLGYVVPVGDATHLAATILQAINEKHPREQRQANFAQAQQTFAWSQALQPLIEFCKHPHYAADKQFRKEVNPPAAAAAATQADAAVIEQQSELQRRNDWLDEVVVAKDAHIQYLEDCIRRLEGGRVVQGLNTLQRVLGKK